MKEKLGGNILRYENHLKKPSNVIRIMVCPADRLTMMLPKGRRGPKGDRKKTGRGLAVEKIIRTKFVNAEMVFKTKFFFEISAAEVPNALEMKNRPKYQLLKCRMLPK